MNSILKTYFYLLVLAFISTTSCTNAQEQAASVQVLARSLENKVLLRWAVDQPYEWKQANDYGFLIERATISRNGEAVIPIERQMLVSSPLKPKPQEEWIELANNDQNVAVLAQALFGKSFKTTAPSKGVLGNITAVNNELEQRFTFGLLAAEQSFDGALLAGWAFEDSKINANEKYVYKISVALTPESKIKINEGSTFAGSSLFEELPKPIGVTGSFKDNKVELSWNFDLLSSFYTSYQVERSENGSSFYKMNKAPIFNATNTEGNSTNTMFYADSIPNNIPFYYRIKGKTAFGEIGPASEIISGSAIKSLGFAPRISKKEIPDDYTAILHWEFKEEDNKLIKGFELKRSNKVDGPFATVQKDIPPNSRKTTFKNLQRINYFTIVAIGKNGVESPSFATIVQPVDSIPPMPPKNLNGVIDTTGILTLTWEKNIEQDLGGYRIFRAFSLNQEFSEITNKTHYKEEFIDTVKIKNLNTKVYYKIQAEDQRYNRSKFSEIITITLPDLTPPSSPVLKQYEVVEKGVKLKWIPSSSKDVASHSIYRKRSNEDNTLWQIVLETNNLKDTLFINELDSEPNTYSYLILAKDSTGLESKPTRPLNVTYRGSKITKEDIKFDGFVNRELRYINLSWKIKNQDVFEYRLYKGKDENNLKVYKTFNSSVKNYNDVTLTINTSYTYALQVIAKNGSISEMKKIELKY
ncbi:fibronectin type III domain-containing protein [Maribacter aquivivus]|uniref:fibronectin type III domain-containing protein n=1 Tax=Maribacter aquivivus TaxID=228958 RepID=UPI00248F648A|nr:hypothetical protein [Maribacter aquivivus]